ncbi:hypothetical protein AB0L05_21115 [Nonomuraea pusilla]|uniref:hypothetical protein n=1 Tax=Nonomuraea pusilla TaxID=46177 RepID=UPI0033300A3D
MTAPSSSVQPLTDDPSELDYYLLLAHPPAEGGPGERPLGAPAEGVVVEEFTLADDHTATALAGAARAASDPGWWSSARSVRAPAPPHAPRRR